MTKYYKKWNHGGVIMKRKIAPLMLIALSLIIAVILSGCSENGRNVEEIRIGVTGPLTGPTANSGVASKQGMELAVAEWNEKGGIEVEGNKLPIKMYFEDNQGKPDQGVSTAEKLFNNEEVDFLIGDAFASSVTMAIMDLADQYEKPILSGEPVSSAISDKISENPDKYEYFWKGNVGSDAYGDSVYQTVKMLEENGDFQPTDKTVSFVVEDTDYGRSNADEVAKLLEGDGWKVVAYETVEVGHTEFYPQLTKLGSLKPNLLVSVFTADSSGVALVKQINETKLKTLHTAVYYPTRPEFIENAKSASEGLVWIPLMFEPLLRENQVDFAAAIKEKWNVVATPNHALGYDTMNNALTSIAEAQSLDSEKIVEQLAKLDRDGILGRFVFDDSNHTIKAGPEYIPVPAVQIQDEKNAIIWPKNISTSEYQK